MQLWAASASPAGLLSPAAWGRAQACPEGSLTPFPEASVGPTPAPSLALTSSPPPPPPPLLRLVTPGFPHSGSREQKSHSYPLSCPPAPARGKCGSARPVRCLTASHGPGLSLCVSSTVSKQRKNVISCVTVHDSPYSDSSSNTSPYSVQQRAGHNAPTFDTKGSLEPHCTGNPRTIIVPPLKTQASEVLVECDSLGPGNSGRSCQEHLSGGWCSAFCSSQSRYRSI